MAARTGSARNVIAANSNDCSPNTATVRKDRRPGLPIEPVWKFYPKYLIESVSKLTQLAILYSRLRRLYLRLQKNPKRFRYTDLALTPVTEHDVEELEMFHTPSAAAFVAQEQRRQHARVHAAVG